jgi:hypothetical protein
MAAMTVSIAPAAIARFSSSKVNIPAAIPPPVG